MAYEELIKSVSLKADSTLAVYTGVPGLPGSADPNGGKQYHFVKVTGADTVGIADTTANEKVIGVCQNKPQYSGMAATIALNGCGGISKVKAGGNISAGAPVKVDSSGRAVAATPGTDIALYVGVALSASTGADQIISVLLV
jgi:hypothetical protein